MPFKPVGKMLLLEPVETEKVGSLYVFTNAEAKYAYGKVVAVGPLVGKTDDLERLLAVYSPGDVVVYSIYGKTELSENGKKYVLVPEKELLAKFEQKSDGEAAAGA